MNTTCTATRLATLLALSLCIAAGPAHAKKKNPPPPPPPPSAVADLEATALRIYTAEPVGNGTVFTADTVATPVHLSTSDPDSGPINPSGSLEFYSDGISLSTDEAVDIVVDGQTILHTRPAMYNATLQTDQGPVTGLAFSDGVNAYLLPSYDQDVAGVTNVVADSSIVSNAITNVSTFNYSLIPLGSHAVPGLAFEQYSQLGVPLGAGVRPYMVFDADGIRGTTDSLGEELLLTVYTGNNGSSLGGYSRFKEKEVRATVRFAQGDTGSVLGIYHYSTGGYGSVTENYVFDSAGLAALGHSIYDVVEVTGITSVDHDLTWAQLGFSE